MADAKEPRVLFYNSSFFRRSETFIYRQAINPRVLPFLLSKRFYTSAELPAENFTKFKFRQSIIDRIGHKWLKKGEYYGRRSLEKMKKKLQGHSIDLIHAQFGGNGIRILPLARLMNIPLIVSFHGFDASKKLSSASYRNGLKDVFDYASAIIVCNTGMSDVLPLTESHRAKVHWVPYGIDIEQFSNNNPPVQSGPFNILHVGRLVEKKGVPDLIRAFAKASGEVDQMTLHIAGEGREESECRALVDEYNLNSKVIFHGWKSPHEVKEMMQQCDLFVLNSRVDSKGDAEGLPNGILEAMAMSKPILSTHHAGIPLAVENGVTGALVKERDTDALAQQIVHLYHHKELRESMGKAGRAKAENLFTLQRMHENLYNIYRKAANK